MEEETGRVAEGLVRNDPGRERSGQVLTLPPREMFVNFKSTAQSCPQVVVYSGTEPKAALTAAPEGRSLGGQKPRCLA